MKKYEVTLQKLVDMTIIVEAENEDEAIDKAYDHSYLDGYAGNGGLGDKLIGTNEENVSLGPGEEPLEGEYQFSITVDEVTE